MFHIVGLLFNLIPLQILSYLGEETMSEHLFPNTVITI